MQWKKPDNDGGNPVNGYIVEYKEVDSNEWVQCNNYPVKLPEYTCSNVAEGSTYEFRVKAVNDAGAGLPSKPSVPQKAQTPICMLILYSNFFQQ